MGFKTFTCEVPSYKVITSNGFTTTEVAHLMEFCRCNTDRILHADSTLEYVKSNKIELLDDVRNKYANCKILLTNMDISDMQHIRGMVYAISRSRESFKALCELQGVLEQNKQYGITMIAGGYGGGFVGVQYINE